MKLVIEIPEEKYEWIKAHNLNIDNDSIVGAVANGTPYEERPKGEWKCTKQGDIPITDRCTNCNYKMKWYRNKHKFCPECGAEMRSVRGDR